MLHPNRNLLLKIVLIVSVLMVVLVISYYARLNWQAQARQQTALSEIPIFPTAELRNVSYDRGHGDREPAVTIKYRLTNADQRFTEIAKFYDEELKNRGWKGSLTSNIADGTIQSGYYEREIGSYFSIPKNFADSEGFSIRTLIPIQTRF